jgi:DnaJ like chaperone protein
MYWRGKLLGLFFGLLIIKNPLGALIGLLVGHYFDTGLRDVFQRAARNQLVFLDTLFSVMGHIAKSDGRVSEREIELARDLMQRLQLTAEQRQAAMVSFSRGKNHDFSVEQAIRALQQTCRPDQICLFFNLQIQVAYGDGHISPSKQRIFGHIGEILGIEMPFMGSEQHRHRQHHYKQTAQPFSQLDDYAVLNISPSASDADVKKAYRRLMSQHHPDKISSKGVSAEKLKQATEKTQEIKAAYDRIRAARGSI